MRAISKETHWMMLLLLLHLQVPSGHLGIKQQQQLSTSPSGPFI
jgi:hypothetical protein